MCYNMQGQARTVSQTVKTSPSHGEDMGSIPVWVTSGTPMACQFHVGFPSRWVCEVFFADTPRAALQKAVGSPHYYNRNGTTADANMRLRVVPFLYSLYLPQAAESPDSAALKIIALIRRMSHRKSLARQSSVVNHGAEQLILPHPVK